MRTRINGATCMLPTGRAEVDIILDGSQIVDVDAARSISVEETVDAKGLYLLPGVIDAHVHFREPGFTHKEDLASGSRACAKGGITTFFEMPNTRPATITCKDLHDKLELARQKSRVNYGFFVGATATNTAELAAAQRTPGIKIYIGSSTGDLLVDDQDALEKIFAETTLPICAHCEDESTVRANMARLGTPTSHADHSKVRDHQAAVIATQRAFDLAFRHQHRFHVVHVTTADEVDLLQDHRRYVTGEACPHHLLFNVDDYTRLGSLVQINPALKTQKDNERLWEGLLEGTLQMVATDHAPHTLEEKQQPYPKSPSGLPAVENSLALMLEQVHQGRCTLEQVVEWMCDAPARVWDIRNKGRLAVGYDADLVLVDLEKEATVRNAEQLTKCGWSPWDGETLRGWPVRTWVMGQTVFQDGVIDDAVRGQEVEFDHQRGGYWATLPSSKS